MNDLRSSGLYALLIGAYHHALSVFLPMTILGMRQNRHHLKPQLPRLLSASGMLLSDPSCGLSVPSLIKLGMPQFTPDA